MQSSNEENAVPQEYILIRNKERRQIKQFQRYRYEDIITYALNTIESIESESVTYRDSITSRESTKYIVAMGEEIESLHKNHTWELLKPPKGRKIISYKWVFKRKEGTASRLNAQFNARLVAKRYT